MYGTSDLHETGVELGEVCQVCRDDVGSTLDAAGYCGTCRRKEDDYLEAEYDSRNGDE